MAGALWRPTLSVVSHILNMAILWPYYGHIKYGRVLAISYEIFHMAIYGHINHMAL
jgi:hypothetical protein